VASEWKEITDGLYKGYRFHISNPIKGGQVHGVSSIQQKVGRRIQQIQRPFVDGGRVKDLAREQGIYTVSIIFFGDNYLRELESFEAILNEGTSGTLILPDEPRAIQASFKSMDKSSGVGESGSKTIQVTWVEDSFDAFQARGAAQGYIPKSITEAASSLTKFVARAKDVINNNQVIGTIRQIESITGDASNAFISAVGLTDQVRGRALTTVANLTGALDGAIDAQERLLELFGVSDEPASGFSGTAVDPESGNPVSDGLADDDVATFEDPIDEPDVEPDQSVDITSLETRDGLNAFQASVIGLLDKSTETLSVDTKGRVDDIKRSLVPVKNAIRDLVRAANPNEARRVQTPSDLSLAEILFFNDVGLENLEDVYERNQSIDDILLVPKGTVVEL
jgi:hypothetical protein|tara:strand:+ start:12623 stop:13807 length:1185 start_codon:yes stop_codon:yes gene_type:complete